MSPWAGMARRPSVRRTRPAVLRPRATPRRISASRSGPRRVLQDDEVGRQPRALAVSRREPGIVPERLGVGRQQVARDRQAAGEELVADLLRRNPEVKDDAFAARTVGAPVGGVALELDAAPGFEADDAEGARADRRPRAGSTRSRRSLRDDRGRGVRDHGREEGDRLVEVDDELRRRHDVEPGEVGGLSVEDPVGSLDHGEHPAALARAVPQEPLPGMAHVAGGQAPAVVEADARLQPDPEASAPRSPGEPRTRATARSACPRRPRSASRRCSAERRPARPCSSARDRGCGRALDRARAGCRRRRRTPEPRTSRPPRLAELGVVDVGRGRVELDAADGGLAIR